MGEPEARPRADIVDLTEALEQSVAAARSRGGAPKASERPSSKGTTRRSRQSTEGRESA